MGIKACLINSLNIFKWIPVIFIVSIAVWSYYAYVIQLCLLSVENTAQQVFYLLFYHISLIMFVWSYWQTIFAPVGKVPKEFRLPPEVFDSFERAETQEQQKQILENFAINLPVVTRTLMGVRYCEKCVHVKPDRAHHCSVCGGCVLKMDHHCPWVNNCVGWSNYKYFVLFLGYAALYCIYISATSMPFFIAFWKNELEIGAGKFHVLFLFFVSTMFFISLSSLFSYHIYLLTLNRSTLESFRPPVFRLGPDKNGFNLGKFNNFTEVFGDDRRMWFLPIFTSKGDGIKYRVRTPHLNFGYDSIGVTPVTIQDTPASFGDGTSFPQKCVVEEESNLLRNGRRTSSEEGEGNGLINLTPHMRNGNIRNPGFTSVLIEPV